MGVYYFYISAYNFTQALQGVILLVALAFSLVEGRRKHPHPGKLLSTAAILFFTEIGRSA
jgi:hypothetical protein